MPTFTVAHAANVIVRALIPIVGVALFGWSGTKLLVVYFADTLASLYALMMLTLYATGTDDGRSAKDGTLGKLRTGIRVAVTPLPFVLVLGFFFGVLPLFVMLDLQEVAWREVLVDRGMWISVACQFAGALTLMLNQLDWVRTVDDHGASSSISSVCSRCAGAR